MATFLLDHNVSVHLAGPLRAFGHACQTAYELGLDSLDDPDVLLWAARVQHVLVTYNEDDFELLHRAWRLWSTAWAVGENHAGIIVARQPPGWPNDFTAREIDQLTRERGLLTNQFFKYQLPDGWLVES